MDLRRNGANNVLVPVKLNIDPPGINDLLKLARVLGGKIHLAGFVADKEEKVSALLESTLALMEDFDHYSTQLKHGEIEVTSKIYVDPLPNVLDKIIEDENIGLTVMVPEIFNNTDHTLNEIPCIKLLNDGKGVLKDDVILLNKISRRKCEKLAKISRIFGHEVYLINDGGDPSIKELAKQFDVSHDLPFDKSVDFEELLKWINQHDPALIAIDKKEYLKKGYKDVVNERAGATVLLY